MLCCPTLSPFRASKWLAGGTRRSSKHAADNIPKQKPEEVLQQARSASVVAILHVLLTPPGLAARSSPEWAPFKGRAPQRAADEERDGDNHSNQRNRAPHIPLREPSQEPFCSFSGPVLFSMRDIAPPKNRGQTP